MVYPVRLSENDATYDQRADNKQRNGSDRDTQARLSLKSLHTRRNRSEKGYLSIRMYESRRGTVQGWLSGFSY